MQNTHYSTKNDTPKDIQSETISQLARRHRLNQSHTTTDEELRNARIELNQPYDTSVAALAEIAHAENNTL